MELQIKFNVENEFFHFLLSSYSLKILAKVDNYDDNRNNDRRADFEIYRDAEKLS